METENKPPLQRQKRVVNVFVLAMLNVSIMASLRNLPLVAEFGYTAIFFFAIAGLFFLIPCALVSAELATGWPKSGGIYIWVREALGDRWGFFAIWMQWVHNVTWYPAMLSFVATTLAYVFFPAIAANKIYVLSVILIGFWGMTILNYFGIKTSALFSTIGVISGTIIPGLFIIFFGYFWFFAGKPTDLVFTPSALVPDFSDSSNFVFLAGLLLAFSGLEVSAGYAGEVKNPRRNFPVAIILAALITFILFMFGSLAIALVIPLDQISLVAGVMDALQIFLDNFHLSWLLPVLGILLIIGAVAEVNSWIIGPVKALYTTSIHGNLPPFFQVQNKRGMPTHLLLFQALIVSVFSFLFLFMPSLSGTYWMLSVLSSEMYLTMYLLMFISAIRLRYSAPEVPRAYRIPHPKRGMWIVSSIGIFSSLTAMGLGFIPPPRISIGNPLFFSLFLIFSLGIMIAIPLIIHEFKKPHWHPLPTQKKDVPR
ncbi:MAG: amino acid permease [Simkaniaceae bacterium]